MVTVNVVCAGICFDRFAAGVRGRGRAANRSAAAAPDEIASCVTFLADESASFVTGAVLVADGGHGLPETAAALAGSVAGGDPAAGLLHLAGRKCLISAETKCGQVFGDIAEV